MTILDVLSVRLLQGTVWFCINLDVLGASKCEAFAGHGVILYQFGCSTLLLSDYIGQAKKCVLIIYSAWKGLAIIACGHRIHYTLDFRQFSSLENM